MITLNPVSTVYTANLIYDGRGIGMANYYPMPPSFYKGKLVCICDNKDFSNIVNEIVWPVKYYDRKQTPMSGDAVYMSKSSKLSRDVVRNSGYKIVLDPEKSNFVVIPYPECSREGTYPIILFLEKENKLMLINIVYRCCAKPCQKLKDKITEFVKKTFDDAVIYMNIDSDSIVHNEGIGFINNCEEYKSLIAAPNNFIYKYIFDIELPTSGGITINPETLCVWEKLADYRILERQIVNSDWKSYPFTIKCVLEYKGSYLDSEFSRQGRDVLRAIRDCKEITVEDYAMFQEWMFSHLGISSDGGYSTTSDWCKMPSDMTSLLKARVAILPNKITETSTLRDIKNKLK